MCICVIYFGSNYLCIISLPIHLLSIKIQLRAHWAAGLNLQRHITIFKCSSQFEA